MNRFLLLATVVVTSAAACGRAEPPERQADPRVADLVAAVSPSRPQKTVTTLAAFGTRHTLSDVTSPDRGIGAAREWILRELRSASPRLQVSFDIHHLAQQGRITRPVELRNVVKHFQSLRPLRIRHLDIQPGQALALLGVDEPMAEVFVNLLTAASLPDEGDVRVFGEPTDAIFSLEKKR
jgi:hypothetical protein